MSRDLLLMIFSLFTWGIGEGLFIYFQPLYLQQWGADPIQIGAILGVAGIVGAVAMTPAGYLADRFGRRPMIWAAWILATLAAWWMALARSLPMFVAAMWFYWLSAFITPPLYSYATAARGKFSTSRVITFVSACFQLGAVFGPLLGGMIGQAFGLGRVYLISGVIFIVSTVVILLIHPQPVEPKTASGHQGHFLRDRRFIGFLGISFITMLALILPQTLTPNFLQNQRGLSLLAIGQLGAFASLGNSVLAIGLGQFPAILAFLAGQIAVALFALLMWRGTGFAWYAVGYFFFGGYRLARLMTMALSRPLVRHANIGTAYGILETVNTFGSVIAPVLAGMLYTQNPTWIYSFSLIFIGLSLAGSAWFLLTGRHALPAGTAEPATANSPNAREDTHAA